MVLKTPRNLRRRKDNNRGTKKLSKADFIRRNAKPVSNAEEVLRQDFEEAGLLDGSFQNNDYEFSEKDRQKTGLRGTNIDRHYLSIQIAFFFDGPHHKRTIQERKDEKIDSVLRADGCVVKRFPYTPPISLQRRFEILKEATKILLEHGYQKNSTNIS